MLKLWLLVLLLFPSACKVDAAALDSLHETILRIGEVQNSDLVFFVDNYYRNELSSMLKLNEQTNPVFIFDFEHLVEESTKYVGRKCPVYMGYKDVEDSPLAEQMRPNEAVLPITKLSKSIFFMASPHDLMQPLSIINNSIMICPQSNDLGIFGWQSKLFFFGHEMNQLSEITNHPYVKHHPSAFLFTDDNRLGARRFSLFCSLPCNAERYHEEFGRVSLLSSERKWLSIKEVLQPPKHFFGKVVTGSGFVAGFKKDTHYSRSQLVPTLERYEPNAYRLLVLEKALNFTPSYYVPNVGSVLADGWYVGSRGAIANFQVDMMFSAYEQTFNEIQIGHFAQNYEDVLSVSWTLYSPLSRAGARTFLLIEPFQWQLWLALALTLVLASLGIKFVVMLEAESYHEPSLMKMGSGFQSFWYCIGTFCAEDIFSSTTAKASAPLRVSIILWLLFSLLLTAGYSGALYSFLSSPNMEKPVDTVQEALESGLDVVWVLFKSVEAAEEYVEHSVRDVEVKALFSVSQKMAYSRGKMTKAFSEVVKGESIVVGGSLVLDGLVATQFTGADSRPRLHNPGTIIHYVEPNFATSSFPVINRFGQRMSECLGWLHASGILNESVKRYLVWGRREFLGRGGVIPMLEDRDSFVTFSLWDMQGIFYALATFVVLALVLLSVEKCLHISV